MQCSRLAMLSKVVFILVVAIIVFSDARKKTSLDKVANSDPFTANKQCSLNIKKFLSVEKEPLILDVKKVAMRDSHDIQRLDIARPEVINGKEGVITVDGDEELLVVCSGVKNSVADSNQESVYVKCDDGELTLRGGGKVTKESIACKNSEAYASVKVTAEVCGSHQNNGVIVQLGFQLKDGSWFPQVDICHNITLGNSYWAGHSIYGHSIRGGVKSSKRRKFSRGSKKLFRGVIPDKLYSQNSQKDTLNKILGSGQSDKYLKKDVLARGHLAPDADFIFQSEQMLTYFFANVAPQWQNFNAGNWLTIENAVRDLAAKTDLTLNVYTGTYGVLKLTDSSNKDQPIYLEPSTKMIPVPEVFWKVVQHPVTKSCTVVVGHNNVFLNKAPTPICTKTVPDGWPTKNLDNIGKGYTYYCDYQSFTKTVDYEPDLECKDLFEFPEILTPTSES